ncbi:MAG: LacI family DNA-binding transcriptional regulator [Chloroflexota bacterium]
MATVTIRDVARTAGVGIGTVSRVLNDSPLVSEETRLKVLDAIKLLDYSPSTVARSLSRGRSMAVAVIAPFFTRRSYIERLQGIENVLSASGYDLILYNVETVGRRDDCLRTVPRGERLDGMLVLSLSPTEAEAKRWLELEFPTVLIDAKNPRLTTVRIDDQQGAQTAVQHLIEMGHTRIAYIGERLDENPFNFQPITDRFNGYCEALAYSKIPFRPEYHRQGKYGWNEARRMAHELFELAEPPTGIFAYSDTLAFGVLEAAQQAGIRVPDELSVIGFDDVEIAQYFQLTTISQPLYESGARGAELLLARIQEVDRESGHQIILPTELVIRNTTASSPQK